MAFLSLSSFRSPSLSTKPSFNIVNRRILYGMSKAYIFLAILGALAISAAAFFIIMNRSGADLSGQKDEEILLFVRSGDVSYKKQGMESFAKATTSPIAITSKSYVYTGKGTATILFPDNSSVDLDTYTELEVTYENKSVSLYQTLGSTYHRIQTLLSGSTYEVRTPGTLAAVRGTKFAVKYDKNTKMTKVAVTENVVQVAKQLESGISTEVVMLEEGQTAKVDETRKATSTESRGILIVETATETDMKEWTERNLQLDKELDSLREEKGSSEEAVREMIKTTILKESAPQETVVEEVKKDASVPPTQEKDVQVEKKREVVPETQLPKDEPQPEVKQETSIPAQPVIKIDEEIFFDRFSDLFIRNFYLDNTDSTCVLTVSPEQRVSAVSAYASASGYPFSSNTLLSFARAIDAYCKEKSPDVKLKLQGRFDAEFPFNESI